MQPELKQFKDETLDRILKSPLTKTPSYFGEVVGNKVNNELIGLEFPQVLEWMEKKNWIKKKDSTWCLVSTELASYKRFMDLRNRLISSESKIEEIKQDILKGIDLQD